GRGERAGQADGPKQYRKIGGRAVIARTLDVFLAHPRIEPVAVVMAQDDAQLFREAVGANADSVTVVTGGPSRQDSVRLGLLALREVAPKRVLIHDAVRPFLDAELIDRTIEAFSDRQGALPALPV